MSFAASQYFTHTILQSHNLHPRINDHTDHGHPSTESAQFLWPLHDPRIAFVAGVEDPEHRIITSGGAS